MAYLTLYSDYIIGRLSFDHALRSHFSLAYYLNLMNRLIKFDIDNVRGALTYGELNYYYNKLSLKFPRVKYNYAWHRAAILVQVLYCSDHIFIKLYKLNRDLYTFSSLLPMTLTYVFKLHNRIYDHRATIILNKKHYKSINLMNEYELDMIYNNKIEMFIYLS